MLYSLLCNFAYDKDHCWPSQSRLAADLLCSVSTVKVWLRELQGAKLIETRREGQFRSSTYYMLKPSSSGQASAAAFASGNTSSAPSTSPADAPQGAASSEPDSGYQVAENRLVNNLSNLRKR